MEPDELELLDKSVRHALTSAPDADDALEAIGWSDVLAAEPRDAVSVVFGALGELNAVASSLDDVMLDGLGVGTAPGGALALPPFGTWEPPGTLRDGALHVDGLALARSLAARRSRCPLATATRWSLRSSPSMPSPAPRSLACPPSSGSRALRGPRCNRP